MVPAAGSNELFRPFRAGRSRLVDPGLRFTSPWAVTGRPFRAPDSTDRFHEDDHRYYAWPVLRGSGQARGLWSGFGLGYRRPPPRVSRPREKANGALVPHDAPWQRSTGETLSALQPPKGRNVIAQGVTQRSPGLTARRGLGFQPRKGRDGIAQGNALGMKAQNVQP